MTMASLDDLMGAIDALPSVPPPGALPVTVPAALHATLRPYQVDGLRWLVGMYEARISGILADEMGLGKTVQVLSCLLALCERHAMAGPYLVVCPLSLVDNWRSELAKFAPSLGVLVYVGDKNERQTMRETVVAHVNALPKAQRRDPPLPFAVVLTTYDVCNADAEFLQQFRWKYLAVDEAARLKNAGSVLYQTLCSFHVEQSCLITGTPVQNNLAELHALLAFGSPTLFADSERFQAWFKQSSALPALHRLLDKFMLRRTKEHVLKDLPEKREVYLYVGMSKTQRDLYKAILLKDLSAFESGAKSRLVNVLMQLRKCVNHPYLFDGIEPEPFELGEHLIMASTKLRALDRLLGYLKQNGHRVLIFSQMTRVLDILQDYLYFRGYEYERLDGSVRGQERFTAVQQFANSAESFVFLLSTRAGGVGLNLTAADTVIFFDSDFNPQADLQASARVHRIGQTKKVTVIRLLCRDTVEEIIMRRANSKLRLSQAVMNDKGGPDDAPVMPQTADELVKTLRYGMGKLIADDENTKPDEDEEMDFSQLLNPDAVARASNDEREDSGGDSVAATASSANVGDPMSTTNHESIYVFKGFDYSKLQKSRDFEDETALQRLLKEQPLAATAEDIRPRLTRTKTVLTPDERAAKEEETRRQRELRHEQQRQRKEQKRKELWEEVGYESSRIDASDEQLDKLTTTALQETDVNSESDEEHSIVYVDGDVTKPQRVLTNEVAIIVNCVDNSGHWGRGGVFAALDRLDDNIGKRYELAAAMDDLSLGDVHLERVQSGPTTYVANVVAQKRSREGHLSAVMLPELEHALMLIATKALELHASVHLPRIGQRSPKFNWYRTERSLRKSLVVHGIRTLVYYYSPKTLSQAPPLHHVTFAKSSLVHKDDAASDGSVSDHTSSSDTEPDEPSSSYSRLKPALKRARTEPHVAATNSLPTDIDELVRSTNLFHGVIAWIAEPDDALRRLLIAYDADVASVMSPEVTHVIVPNDPIRTSAALEGMPKQHSGTPIVVKVQWVADCIARCQRLADDVYRIHLK